MAYKSTLSSENIQEALDIIHSAVVIGGGILTLDNQSSSEQISSAIGGEDGFNRILERIRGGNIVLGIKVDDTTDNGIIMASIVAPKTENKFTISYLYKGVHYSDEFSLSGSTFSLSQTTEGGGLDSIFYTLSIDDASQYIPTSNPYTFYLTEEKYNELLQAAKNSKIIRAIYTCGVFYSTSILWTSITSDKLEAIYMGRGTTLNGAHPEYQPGYDFIATIEDNTDEEHEEPYSVTLKTTPSLTKEFIEEIFTGNITTHTHDDKYAVIDIENSSISGDLIPSTSLAGSGTISDPYIIDSCEDYAFFILQESTGSGIYKDAISENTTYFKLTRNLYFNETVIAGGEAEASYKHIVFDGNGCSIVGLCCYTNTISTTIEKACGLWILPYMENSIIHDINFVNAKVNSTLISERSGYINALNFSNIHIRCTFDITFRSATTGFAKPISNLYLPSQITNKSTSYIDNLKRKGNFMGYNIKFNSTSISNEVEFPVVLDASCRGYFKFSGTYLVDDNSVVEDAKISFNLVNYPTDQSIDLSNFVFNGITECLTSDISTIDSPTSNSVVNYVVESLNSQDAVSKINNNNSSGFIVSEIEGADAPILPSLQISYEGYARRIDVLEKKNCTHYEPTEDYHPATKKYVDENAGIGKDEVLTKTNTTEYTPTADYHPATKKYVDDNKFYYSTIYISCNTNSSSGMRITVAKNNSVLLDDNIKPTESTHPENGEDYKMVSFTKTDHPDLYNEIHNLIQDGTDYNINYDIIIAKIDNKPAQYIDALVYRIDNHASYLSFYYPYLKATCNKAVPGFTTHTTPMRSISLLVIEIPTTNDCVNFYYYDSVNISDNDCPLE